MVRTAYLTILASSLSLLSAQNLSKERYKVSDYNQFGAFNHQNKVIWQEDFASGIPADWSQQGSSNKALWEYRGPNTIPGLDTGSRGGFAQPTHVIQSNTRKNGFVIFDSGYLDNNGHPLTGGLGPAPAPHKGVLQTDTIDLSKHPEVELFSQNRIRNYRSRFLIAVSTNGGASFRDTLEVIDLKTNQSTRSNFVYYKDLSSIAGGKDSVVLRFIFDGASANLHAGYYYWMLDDIVLREKSYYHNVDFALDNGHQIYMNGQEAPRYLTLPLSQSRPIRASAKLINHGSPQRNVRLAVDIVDSSENVLQTLRSKTHNFLAYRETLSVDSLKTLNSWTPTKKGFYQLVYRVESDSIGPGKVSMGRVDSFPLRVTESWMGLDDGKRSGFIDQYTNTNPRIQCNALATKLRLVSSSLPVVLEGVQVGFSADADTSQSILIEIIDSTDFQKSRAAPVYSESYALNSFCRNDGYFEFHNPAHPNGGVSLSKKTYFLKVNFQAAPNVNSTTPVAYSSTWNQPGQSSTLLFADSSSLSGFSDFHSPFIRARLQSTCGQPIQDTIRISSCNSLSFRGCPVSAPGISHYRRTSLLHCDTNLVVNLQPDTLLAQVKTLGDTLIAPASMDSYQWLKCGGTTQILDSAQSRKLVVPDNNSRYAVIVRKGICVDTSVCHRLSFTESNTREVGIYPNPARDQIIIKGRKDQDTMHIKFFDLSGRLRRSYKIDPAITTKINPGLIPGVYLVRIINSRGGYYNQKLILQ